MTTPFYGSLECVLLNYSSKKEIKRKKKKSAIPQNLSSSIKAAFEEINFLNSVPNRKGVEFVADL